MLLTAKYMYETYGICEWNEKAELLSNAEYNLLKSDIKDNRPSLLLEKLKAPFPEFAYEYFYNYPKHSASKYLSDPAFGYKLYMIPFSHLKDIRNKLCNEEGTMTVQEKQKRNDKFSQFKEYMSIPVDRIPFIMSSVRYNKELRRKFIYLTKYIDQKEAEKLNTTTVTLFQAFGCDGYELSRKLGLFNPIARHILDLYYGFEYGERTELKDVYQALNLKKHETLKRFIELVEPMLLKDFTVLKHNLNPIGYRDGTILYGNRSFRNFDLGLTSKAYYQNVLSDQEREVLPPPVMVIGSKTSIYILKKYVFPSMSTIELSDYLVVDHDKIVQGETLPKKEM